MATSSPDFGDTFYTGARDAASPTAADRTADLTSGNPQLQRLVFWDYVAIILYFVLVVFVGVCALFRQNRGTVSGYFLAGRFMWWLPVGASLFASNIGSEHFIGLAGSGAAGGLGVGAFALNGVLLLQLLGWLFLPVFIASGASTLPEFLRKRFGGQRIRVYLALLSLLLYVFTKISVNLYAGALFIKLALGWNIYLSIFALLLITAISTVTGGLTAVIYTDTLQTFIMLIGGVVLTFVSLREVGGYSMLMEHYANATAKIWTNSSVGPSESALKCAQPSPNYDVMLRGISDPEMPWLGFILGQTPATIWYWCSDQMMVQRTLAAKSLSHAQGAIIFAGYLKILPFFMMVIPGMVARVLFTDEIACADPHTCMQACGSETACTNFAYPYLVLRLLPDGMRGIMMAVMLAALMSDLTSIFNSASTLFTIDIYQKIRKSCTMRELMIVGRVFVLVMIGISVIWVPIIDAMEGGQLYIYIQSVAAYLAPPIAAVYLLAILWKRSNEKGAFCSLMFGMVLGVVRLILNFVYLKPPCGQPDTRPALIKDFHYMYFAILLFWSSTLVAIVVSLLTEPVDSKKLIRTTFWTRFDQSVRDDEHENLEKRNNLTAKEGNEDVEKMKGKEEEIKLAKFRGEEEASIEAEDEEICEGGCSKESCSKESCRDAPKRLCSWFCGLDGANDSVDSSSAAAASTGVDEHLEKLTELEQDPHAKTFLNVNLVVIVAIGLFLFVVFSLKGHWRPEFWSFG